MEYVIIAIVLIVIGIAVYNSLIPKIKKKKYITALKEYMENSNVEHTMSIETDLPYDIHLKTANHEYYIKIVIIPSYSEIQINNRSTWELKYGAGNTPGKVQPHRRYLTEVADFMKSDYSDNIEKIILFSPKPKKIVKYINECEIIFVDYKTDVYGAKIYSRENFIAFKR